MSVGRLYYVLIVYSLMEHVTWKSPGLMCGWVGRILHPDSCMHFSVFLIQSASFSHLVCRYASLSTTFALSQLMIWFSSTALPQLTVLTSLGNILHLCRVGSFYITVCTNWMKLFNTIFIIYVECCSCCCCMWVEVQPSLPCVLCWRSQDGTTSPLWIFLAQRDP